MPTLHLLIIYTRSNRERDDPGITINASTFGELRMKFKKYIFESSEDEEICDLDWYKGYVNEQANLIGKWKHPTRHREKWPELNSVFRYEYYKLSL
jgi:hypothetical protein